MRAGKFETFSVLLISCCQQRGVYDGYYIDKNITFFELVVEQPAESL